MKKPLSSCFDCLLLRDHPNGQSDQLFWCAGYDKEVTYDYARTPNNCPRKKRNEEDIIVQFPREEILARLYDSCCELADQLGRPFTMRELFEHVEYMNKNSLWELLEMLVKAGKVEKQDATLRTWAKAVYRVKSYWPVDWSKRA
jgi:hypothetical protein